MEAGESSRRESNHRGMAHGWTDAGHLAWRETSQALHVLSISSGKQPWEVWRMFLYLKVQEVLFSVWAGTSRCQETRRRTGVKAQKPSKCHLDQKLLPSFPCDCVAAGYSARCQHLNKYS